MAKSSKTTVDMVNDAIDKADLEDTNNPKETLENSGAHLKQASEKLAKDVERYVSEGMDRLQKAAGEYGEKLNKVAATAGESAKKAYEESQSYVRANPTSTILGAFALGILLGALIRRN